MDGLLAWRKEFPILDKTVYMISHSLGAMPRRTRDRLQEYADAWSERGIRAWEEGWWQMPVAVGDLAGRIIGAGPGEVVMQPNVSISLSTALSCLDWTAKRNRIVSESMNFPSNLYIARALERQGARLITIPSADGITVPTERLLEAIDGETAVVMVSHVLFRSSYIQDLKTITRRAHDLWGALEPRLTGWMAHKHSFAFEPDPIEYADDAFRFLNGTPNVPAMYAARSGYEIINEVGVENIRAKSVRQTARLIELAEEAGFRVNSPRDAGQRGGTVVIDVPSGEQVTKELLRREFLVDYRPGAGIRIAPHFYTKDEELDLTIREIQSITTECPARSI